MAHAESVGDGERVAVPPTERVAGIAVRAAKLDDGMLRVATARLVTAATV